MEQLEVHSWEESNAVNPGLQGLIFIIICAVIILTTAICFVIQGLSVPDFKVQQIDSFEKFEEDVSRVLGKDIEIIGKRHLLHIVSLLKKCTDHGINLKDRYNKLEAICEDQHSQLQALKMELFDLKQNSSARNHQSPLPSDDSNGDCKQASKPLFKSNDFPNLQSRENQDPTLNFNPRNVENFRSKNKNHHATSSKSENNRPMYLKDPSSSLHYKKDLRNTSSKNDTHAQGTPTKDSTPAKVCIVHDSILNGIKPAKLGKGYGCEVDKKRAYTIAQAQTTLQNITSSTDNKPEAVVIHVGVNDLKTTDGKTAAKKYVEVVTKFAKSNPSVKVIVSKVAPTRSAEINKQRHVFNTKITNDFVDSGVQNIFAINHEHLRPYDLYDQLHPNQRGDVKLAVHIGRVLWGLFWTESSRLRRKQQQDWWAEHVMQY